MAPGRALPTPPRSLPAPWLASRLALSKPAFNPWKEAPALGFKRRICYRELLPFSAPSLNSRLVCPVTGECRTVPPLIPPGGVDDRKPPEQVADPGVSSVPSPTHPILTPLCFPPKTLPACRDDQKPGPSLRNSGLLAGDSPVRGTRKRLSRGVCGGGRGCCALGKLRAAAAAQGRLSSLPGPAKSRPGRRGTCWGHGPELGGGEALPGTEPKW